MTDPSEKIDFPLNDHERDFVVSALRQWGGPARCTDELANAIGFASHAALVHECESLIEAFSCGSQISRRDLVKSILAVEISFASSFMGSGLDWSIVTGISDEEGIRCLRLLQRRVSSLQVRRLASTLANRTDV